MKRRKNSNLHVVREPEDPTDKIIEEIMDELNSEDGVTEKEIQEELARRKRKMEPVISDKESDDRCQRQVGSSS